MRVRMGSSVSCLLNDDHLLLLEMKVRDKVMVKEKDGDGTQALFHTWISACNGDKSAASDLIMFSYCGN
jgi:hypothetical protein